jgi:putative ABC transport system permease protein
VKQASAEVDAIVRSLGRQYRELRDFGGQVGLARTWWVGGGRTVLTVLLIAVVFVLMIASLNVANLMLARAIGRRREVHLRLALGASRGRVVRQLLTESVLVSLLGGAIGVALGQWGLDFMSSTIPVERPFFIRFIVDGPVLLYAAAITIFAGITFGIAPALRGTDVRLSQALRDDSGQGGTSRKSLKLRNALVIAEVALSLVLVIGAGLMVRTLTNLERAGAAIQTEGMLTARLRLPEARYPGAPEQRRFFHELVTRAGAQPSIVSVSGASSLPLGQIPSGRGVVTPAMRDPERDAPKANFCELLPGTLEMLGVPLVQGRWFTEADRENSGRVAMISATLAHRLFPGADPLGQRLRFHDEPESLGWRTVVGVVGDVVHDVDELEAGRNPMFAAYLPATQDAMPRMSMLIRARGNTDAAAEAFRATLRAIDPELVAEDLRTLRAEFHFRLWVRRLYASLLGACALIALVIAVVGLYGVMAYSVAQRTREIGIRMALGAQATAVQQMVIRQALGLTLTGIVIGLVGAFALTRFMASVILGVDPTDPPTFFLVTLLLASSGLLAAWVPAYRAVRVDPVVALRHE